MQLLIMTINNNYMTLLMTFHHTHDGFWYVFLDAARTKLITGTLPTLNLSIKNHPSPGTCVFSVVILVSNYHSYKEKTIKLLLYHSFYGDHITPDKNFAAFPPKKFENLSVIKVATFHIRYMCLLLLLCRI